MYHDHYHRSKQFDIKFTIKLIDNQLIGLIDVVVKVNTDPISYMILNIIKLPATLCIIKFFS